MASPGGQWGVVLRTVSPTSRGEPQGAGEKEFRGAAASGDGTKKNDGIQKYDNPREPGIPKLVNDDPSS